MALGETGAIYASQLAFCFKIGDSAHLLVISGDELETPTSGNENDADFPMLTSALSAFREYRLVLDSEEPTTEHLTIKEVRVVHQWFLEADDVGRCSDHEQIVCVAPQLRHLIP